MKFYLKIKIKMKSESELNFKDKRSFKILAFLLFVQFQNIFSHLDRKIEQNTSKFS